MKIYEFALKMRDLASSKVDKLNKLAGKARSKVEQLGAQASKTAGKFQERFPMASRAVAAVGAAASRVIRKMGKLRQVVASGVSAAFKGLKKALLAMGAAATLAFGVATKESMGFNAQMSRVQAISNANAEEFQVLRNKALEMGKSTKFSAREAGQGLEYLGMAGFSAKDAASALGGVLDLAAASGMDLGRTADIASNAISAFGLSANQSDRVADVFAKTITSSNTNLEMLAESMKYLAPTARALGVS
uniref:phage tail tape measure protein n=1 Tax=uncultured Microscilla sp. TaxID=432653 RepID=UPI002636571E